MASANHAVEVAIEERLNDNWPYSPIAWDGVDFDPKADASEGVWLRCTVIWGDATLETMTTSGHNEIIGILDLDLFDKPGNGYGILRERADDLRDLFDRATAGAAEFRAASGPQKIRNTQGWLQIKVSVPFTVDETS